MSQRRALAVAWMSTGESAHAPRPHRHVDVRGRILDLAHRYKRYGLGMIHLQRRQEDLRVNYKRVERLQVRRRKRKKASVTLRQPLLRPALANEVWSMDFVFDRTADGPALKCLNIVDDATHGAVVIQVERAISSKGAAPPLGMSYRGEHAAISI